MTPNPKICPFFLGENTRLFRIYTTNKHRFSRNMSYPSWYMHTLATERSWVQILLLAPFLALLALFLVCFSQHYKCR